ncbi:MULTISPECIES: RNA polymerase sigma-70 factor [unclassified Streptomyces]|uniref:RNA polymerase sigma-70 factor n=1 Tax=unclassified Streptomyces TaxID=2593676 RepID=UPI00225A3FCD|nr:MULTISPECIES: RNA polymerase sigma-70 factor [unclassified Streptomyces]MCX5058560.1 RNA polymerase sigma-70 factor [Streptomyces sp. NBC_00452]MCX5244560.1 RNA polymerase sigma-70 factor [Streptomyces sp. NBC_00201]MCX5289708.1 RNA polymerase sigma-70 factor [Streptomyces sp. NBC_00183]
MSSAIADEFEAHRPRLFGLAYRMLGSADEAEDAVQDAYLRFSGADRTGIEYPAAWLAKVVTNLCLTRLTSARARREQYVGPWLPEPVVTSDGTLGPLESAEQRDAVSMAVLVLLERLSPTERAVYVLREAFGYGHREIAGVLDLTEANCRQLYRRAVQRVGEDRSRFEPVPQRQQELVASFITAAREGDLAGLEKLLAADATWWSDGGGKVSAARRPVHGREKVGRLALGAYEKWAAGVEFTMAEINGASTLVAWAGDTLVAVLALDLREGLITDVWAQVNPDKLEFLRRRLTRP